MNEDLVSIIIPLYNSSKNIGGLLAQLSNQTYNNIEIILIDDGSSDGTHEVIENEIKTNPNLNIIYRYQRNSGPGTARNRGLNLAKGIYTIFIDSDDEFSEALVESMVFYIKQLDVDFVQANYFIKNKGQEVEKVHSDFEDIVVINNIEQLHINFSERAFFNPYLWTKIFRTEIIKDIKFPSLYYSEDQVFIVRLLNNVSSAGFIDCAYYTYVENSDSLVRASFNYRQLDSIKAMKIIINFYENNYQNLIYDYNLKICRYVIYFSNQVNLDGNNIDELQYMREEFNKSYSYLIEHGFIKSNLKISEKLWIMCFKYFPWMNKIIYFLHRL